MTRLLGTALLVVCTAGVARAEPDDNEVSTRLHFIEERLRCAEPINLAWQMTWAGVYGVGMLVQSGRAVVSTDRAERADLIVSAVKAGIGTLARVLRPPNAMFGTRELRGLPDATPEQRLYKLRRAEALLERNAHESDRRYLVVAHAANLALNLIGGLIVWLGYDDLGRAAESTGIGFAVGELSIWSQPWQPKHDWKEYQRRFGGERQISLSATVTPEAGGGVLTIRF